MSDRLTTDEYDEEIESLVKVAVSDALEENPNLKGDKLYEYIIDERVDHEAIDGHKWVIYNYIHEQIVECSHNDDAYLDVYSAKDLGNLMTKKGLEAVIATRAFYAMMADFNMKLQRQTDNLSD